MNLENEEQIKPEVSRRKEVFKVESNKIEMEMQKLFF